MGLITVLLSFTRVLRNGANVSDVKINPGGGQNVTAEHFAGAGDDSFPLTTDYPLVVPVPQNGRVAVVGYIDPLNAPVAQPGDRRIYGRDADGVAVVDVWLKNTGEAKTANDKGDVTLMPDGSILGQNGSGSFELQASGDFVVNGVTITADGSVTIPTSLTLGGKEIAGHNHPAGTPPGTTGPNN